MRRAPSEPVAAPPALLGVLSHPQESKQKAFGSFWVLRAVGTVQGSAPAAAVTPLASEGLRGGPCVCTRLPVLRGGCVTSIVSRCPSSSGVSDICARHQGTERGQDRTQASRRWLCELLVSWNKEARSAGGRRKSASR